MHTQRLKKLTLVKPADGSAADRAAQGRVTHDSRGNAVWHWDIDTGVLSRKSVAELLTSLDAPGALALDAEIERHKDWSGDPYNRGR
jgi:hypothetical protein